jgi:outer membrane protein assembly factor BamB
MNRLATLALLLACSPAVRAADWPQWLGPKRDGSTPEKVEPWKEAPKVLWRQPVGPGFSVPAVAGGRVFVHARVKGKDAEEVVAYDAASGKELWRDAYDRAPYRSAINTGPQASPAVVGGKVYAFGITGVLSCYQADSGKRLWQADVYKQLKVPLPRFGVCCSPLVVGNRVIVAAGGKGSAVVAFDTDKGEIQWQALDEAAGSASPALFALPGKARAVPDVVFMTTLRLIALNPLDGSVSWEHPLTFSPSGTAPSPLVVGDRVVTSTQTNGTVAVRVAVADDKIEAKKDWQNKDVSAYFSTGVSDGKGRLYLITNVVDPLPRADLSCLDLATGKELWKKESVGYFHAGVVRTGNDKLLLLDDAGGLKLLEADPRGYKELCKVGKVCGGTFTAPVLSGGRLYVRDDKEIICLQLSE